jgi:hypothetical protein
MAGEAARWIAVIGAASLFFFVVIRFLGERERRVIDATLRVLPKHELRKGEHFFTGAVRGVDLTLRLLIKNSEASGRGGPFSEVLLDDTRGIAVRLVPQNAFEADRAERGLSRDTDTGDDAFDRAFIVEVSPATLAPVLFDAELRRTLVSLSPVRVHERPEGGLRIEKRFWEVDVIPRLVDAGAQLALGIRRAAAANADRERRDPSHATAARLDRVELERTRARSLSWTKRAVALVVLGGLLLIGLRAALS